MLKRADAANRKMNIQICAASNIGCVRKNNEDNLYLSGHFMREEEKGNFHLLMNERTDSYVCAVFDGMGGENAGEKASFEAAVRFFRTAENPLFSKAMIEEKIAAINDYVMKTNSAIYEKAHDVSEYRGMGTTISCLLISDKRAAAINVGDSRTYLFRDGDLTQLTRDHSESERLIRLGQLSREQARDHKSRFILNRYLGMPTEEGILEAEVSAIFQLQEGDKFLLCSDGLTDMVNDEEIRSILLNCTDSEMAAGKLVEQALAYGGKDNVSVIVVILK